MIFDKTNIYKNVTLILRNYSINSLKSFYYDTIFNLFCHLNIYTLDPRLTKEPQDLTYKKPTDV